jgi:hypothetical protein
LRSAGQNNFSQPRSGIASSLVGQRPRIWLSEERGRCAECDAETVRLLLCMPANWSELQKSLSCVGRTDVKAASRLGGAFIPSAELT